jgi:hypothetical protein
MAVVVALALAVVDEIDTAVVVGPRKKKKKKRALSQ